MLIDLTLYSQDVLWMNTRQGKLHLGRSDTTLLIVRPSGESSVHLCDATHSLRQQLLHTSAGTNIQAFAQGQQCFGTSPRGAEFNSVSTFQHCKYNLSPFIRAPEGERRHFKASLFHCPQAPRHEITAVQQRGTIPDPVWNSHYKGLLTFHVDLVYSHSFSHGYPTLGDRVGGTDIRGLKHVNAVSGLSAAFRSVEK